MWYPYPIVAMWKCAEHRDNAINELNEALYHAKLDYVGNEKSVKRIQLALDILQGRKDNLINNIK